MEDQNSNPESLNSNQENKEPLNSADVESGTVSSFSTEDTSNDSSGVNDQSQSGLASDSGEPLNNSSPETASENLAPNSDTSDTSNLNSDSPTSGSGTEQTPPVATAVAGEALVVGRDSDAQTAPLGSSSGSGAVTPSSGGAASSGKSPKPSRKFLKRTLIVTAAIVVLAGASAAAFYTVYLPHQPWYVLDTALKNTMSQTQLTADGTMSGSTSSSSNILLNLSGTSAVNLQTKSILTDLDLKVAGVTIPTEARLVGGNLYIQVDNLSQLKPLIGLADPSLAPTFGTLASQISGHWLEASNSLLTANKSLKCLLNENWTLSSSDSNYLVNTYLKQPFFTVNKASTTTVNGVSSEELVTTMNNAEAGSYLKDLGNLQIIKQYQQCSGEKGVPLDTSALSKAKTTPVTFWVNKSNNLIDKLSLGNLNGTSFTATLNYGPVSVEAPANAIPLNQLLTEIESSLKVGAGSKTATAISSSPVKLTFPAPK